MNRPVALMAICAATGVLLTFAPANAASPTKTPPPGATYWIRGGGGDVLGIRRNGKTIRIGNPLAPCFTGRRTSGNWYAGGGDGQNGGYSRYKVRVNVKRGKLRVYNQLIDYKSTWNRTTKARASRAYNGTNPKDWFSDCKRR